MSMHRSLRWLSGNGHARSNAHPGQAKSVSRKRACQRAAKARVEAAAAERGETVQRYIQLTALAYRGEKPLIINPATMAYPPAPWERARRIAEDDDWDRARF